MKEMIDSTLLSPILTRVEVVNYKLYRGRPGPLLEGKSVRIRQILICGLDTNC
jgi:hypothetical protein